MPVKSSFSWDDIVAAALPISIPIGIAGIGWYFFLKDKDQVQWFSRIKTPDWLITNPSILAPIDLITIAPVGYAAHVVCKEGFGNDRKLALGLYSAGLVVWLSGIPIFAKKKDLKYWAGVIGLSAGVWGATAVAFYKINNYAGLALAPLTVWSGYQAIGYAVTAQSNRGP